MKFSSEPRGNRARKGPQFVARHFSRQISRVQNQSFTRIFALREFFPDYVPGIKDRDVRGATQSGKISDPGGLLHSTEPKNGESQ